MSVSRAPGLRPESLAKPGLAPARLAAACLPVALLSVTGSLRAQRPPPRPSLAPVAAPSERVSFRHLTIRDGLSQNAVAAVTQDRRGFMWFGTRDGLNRYDGYVFVVFRHDPFDPTSLPDNDVTALLEDSRGRLWVGTRTGGLGRFDRDRESFRRYPQGPAGSVTSLAEDVDGSIWIGTDGDGLYRLSSRGPGESGEGRSRAVASGAGEGAAAGSRGATRGAAVSGGAFERYSNDPKDSRSLDDDRVYAVLVDRRGALWVGTEAGLNRRAPPPGSRMPAEALDRSPPPAVRFTRYGPDSTSSEGVIDAPVTALHEDARGRLWIGSVPGVSVLGAGRTRFVHHFHRYRTYRYGWGRARAVLADRTGRIWISTASELMRLDPETGRFTYLRHDPLDLEGASSNQPTALFQDRSGVLWVGTNGHGLDVHDPKAGRFHTFRRPEGRLYRLAGFSVYTLFQDSRGRVWIGAGVLYRWDPETGEFVSFETSSERPDDFGNTGVWEIVEDPPGLLWVGTNRGLYRYELETGSYRQYRYDPADPEGLPEAEVWDVFRARDGGIWAVTANHLARLEDPAGARFRNYRYTERPTRGAWTFPSVQEDPRGRIWLGSNRGLVRFDPDTETFRRYRNDPGNPASLSHDVIRALQPDSRQPGRYLWIGTAGGGLNRLDLEKGTFRHFTTKDGLPNDVVYGILPGDTGNLWLSTNRGISRFDPRSGHFRNYDARDGLQSDEFNSGATHRSQSGELFFGGLYGFNHFRPEEIEDNPHVPPVVLTGFRRDNRPETVGDSNTVLTRAIPEADTLRLSHGDDVIAFEFAALDFSAPRKNRYAYRLEGFNERWIEAGTARTATYTNLPAGSYTFRVRGSNNDGVWNEEGASLAVIVAPAWWGTWWAYGFYAFLVLGALYALRRYEMSRMQLESRLEMERLEAEKLRELDRARSRFFADVSHEFRTPLTLTLGPLDDLLEGLHGELAAGTREQVDLARRSAGRVLALIDEILELARLEAGRTPLRARSLALGPFVQGVAREFAPLAERRMLSFDVQLPSGPVVVYGDPECLEKVLSNLLSNAMKFTPEGGAVRIFVEAEPDVVRVRVRDSGPGIPAVQLSRVFDRFHRVEASRERARPGTGIGLALAKELVELHGGSIAVESEEGFGSSFIVTLRRGRAHLAADQIAEEELAEGERGPRRGVPGVTEGGRGPDAPIGVAGGRGDDGADTGPTSEDVTTVLVVEDNPEVRAYVRRHLTPAFRVLEAEGGEEGLEMARRRLPDLVLSDVMMPGMDGYALCRALKQDPDTDFIPVILLTARAAGEDRLAGLREQADDYVTKPFDMQELLARMENLIASRKKLRQRYSGPGLRLHPESVDVEPDDARFLERVRRTIEEHLGDEDFSVARLARAVAHSRSHLHRRLRALLDESPSAVIRRMRLERAAQLIEGGAGSIGEIAYAVGYKSVAHFSNSFLEHFGVRPSAYRAVSASTKGGGES